MHKILVHVSGSTDRFFEIFGLKEIWVARTFHPGVFVLMYQDRKYRCNSICYSRDKAYLFSLKSKLSKAYANGTRSIQL